MKITNDFKLGLPPDRAFQVLVDLDRVVPCMPGAELGAALPDGSRALRVHVRLGPMRFIYDGSVRIVEHDREARRAVLAGSATEARGQGDATATITMHVTGADGGSRVDSVAELDLTGRAAQMGHGVVQAVAKQLIGEMAANIEERLSEADSEVGEAEPSPPRGASASGTAEDETGAPAGQSFGHSTAATADAPTPRPISGGRLVLSAVTAWLLRIARRTVRSRGSAC